jgi:hypothetical protein
MAPLVNQNGGSQGLPESTAGASAGIRVGGGGFRGGIGGGKWLGLWGFGGIWVRLVYFGLEDGFRKSAGGPTRVVGTGPAIIAGAPCATEGLNTVEIGDGAAVETLGLGGIAHA